MESVTGARRLLPFSLLTACICQMGCGGGGDRGSSSTVPLEQVAAPAFLPNGGRFAFGTFSVTITSSTPEATIRYTSDGSTPSQTSGDLYTGAIQLAADATLRAIAYKDGMADSEITERAFTVYLQAAAFNPPRGTFASPGQTVAIRVPTGATARYTSDGSAPSATNGTVYAGPILIDVTTTLRAIAYAPELTSEISEAAFTVDATGSTPVFTSAALSTATLVIGGDDVSLTGTVHNPSGAVVPVVLIEAYVVQGETTKPIYNRPGWVYPVGECSLPIGDTSVNQTLMPSVDLDTLTLVAGPATLLLLLHSQGDYAWVDTYTLPITLEAQ